MDKFKAGDLLVEKVSTGNPEKFAFVTNTSVQQYQIYFLQSATKKWFTKSSIEYFYEAV